MTKTTATRLGVLESAGLISLAAIQPELEYVFRHILVKDAAYASLVKGDRRGLHQLVAETLERLYLVAAEGTPFAARPPRGELLPLLGHHYAEAGQLAPAALYFTQAGDAAARVYANSEAIAHYTRAIEMVRDWPNEHERLGYLYARRGRAQELSGQQADAVGNYLELEELGRASGQPALMLSALTARATVMAVPSVVYNPHMALELTQAALSLARELADQAAEAKALWTLLLAEMGLGQRASAVRYGQQALALARELDLREQVGYVLSDLSRAYLGLGDIAASRQAAEEARPLWEAEGNLPMLAETLSNLGSSYFFTGDYAEALTHLREAQSIARAIGNAWGQAYSLMLQSFLLMDQGRVTECQRSAAECLRLSAEGGLAGPQVSVKTSLALLYSYLGQPERGLALAQEAVSVVEAYVGGQRAEAFSVLAFLYTRLGDVAQAEHYLEQTRAAMITGDAWSFAPLIAAAAEGELALALGDPERALAVTQQTVLGFEHAVFKFFLAQAMVPWAQALRALGRDEEAQAVLLQARAHVLKQGSRLIQWSIVAELAILAELRGEREEASALWAEAHASIDFLVQHMDDPVLRASFLQAPGVQAALAAAGAAWREPTGPD